MESQSVNSTRRLVDSDAEQEALESSLEMAKPRVPTSPRFGPHLDYLLSTPFRHPPLKHGSRFGTRREPSLWYGSQEIRTALAESTYYCFLLLEGTTADLELPSTAFTVFRAAVLTPKGADLSQPPFASFTDQISHPDTYEHAQPLGSALREHGVEAFLFQSARSEPGALNVALFAPVFSNTRPRESATWVRSISGESVEWRASLSRPGSRSLKLNRTDVRFR